jgi:hypothetical protein
MTAGFAADPTLVELHQLGAVEPPPIDAAVRRLHAEVLPGLIEGDFADRVKFIHPTSDACSICQGEEGR